MKNGHAFVLLLILSACAGCRAATTTVLSEIVRLPNTWHLSDLHVPERDEAQEGKPIIRMPTPPYHKYFGLQEGDYSYIYPGLKLLRCTLLSQNDNYIFEVQTDGDIELAKKYYGNAMRFGISIRGTGLNIFTTASMQEAVLVSGGGKLLFFVDKHDKLVSARWDSDYDVKARLKLQIEKDRIKIYLPKKELPERAAEWWPEDKGSFRYWIESNLALPPLKPFPTNLPDVFYAPEICYLTPPAQSIYRQMLSFEVRVVPESKGKSEPEKVPRNK